MPLDVSDIIQVTYRSTWAAQRILMVRHFVVNTTTSTASVLADLSDIAEIAADSSPGTIFNTLQAALPSNVQIDTVRAQRIYPNRTAFVDQVVDLPGGNANDADAGNVAAVITLRTELGGRDQISNVHVGPVPGNVFTEGFINPTYLTTLDALKTALLSGLLTDAPGNIGLKPVVFHSKKVPPTWDQLLTGTVQQTLRTMSRRTVGRGI